MSLTIGSGGLGGINNPPSNGQVGGNTVLTINGTNYTAIGGSAGIAGGSGYFDSGRGIYVNGTATPNGNDPIDLDNGGNGGAGYSLSNSGGSAGIGAIYGISGPTAGGDAVPGTSSGGGGGGGANSIFGYGNSGGSGSSGNASVTVSSGVVYTIR
jgi:hypothetical protein